MIAKLTTETLRYINAFYNVTRIRTIECFSFNSTLIFVVPKPLMSAAIGEKGKNVEKLSKMLNKRIKIVAMPMLIKTSQASTTDTEVLKHEAKQFIEAIIYPNKIQSIEIAKNTMVIHAGAKTKAMLIGREKRNIEQIKALVKRYFGLDLAVR